MTTTVAPTAAVAKTDKGITALLKADTVAQRLTPLLPKGLTYDALIQHVYFAAQKDPNILKCTPASIVQAVARALRSGLEIGETCHLLPFGSVCTFVADYKGLGQLLIASGSVRKLEIRGVYEGDQFEISYGSEGRLRHVPGPIAQRGRLLGAYVFADLPMSRYQWDYMHIEDVNAIRAKFSRSWKEGACPEWYACKTVLRRFAKLLPKDRRVAPLWRALEEDEAAEAEDLSVTVAPTADVSADGEDLSYEGE